MNFALNIFRFIALASILTMTHQAVAFKIKFINLVTKQETELEVDVQNKTVTEIKKDLAEALGEDSELMVLCNQQVEDLWDPLTGSKMLFEDYDGYCAVDKKITDFVYDGMQLYYYVARIEGGKFCFNDLHTKVNDRRFIGRGYRHHGIASDAIKLALIKQDNNPKYAALLLSHYIAYAEVIFRNNDQLEHPQVGKLGKRKQVIAYLTEFTKLEAPPVPFPKLPAVAGSTAGALTAGGL